MKLFHRLLRYPEVWILTSVALLTRLWQIGLPNALVFDEVYFRTFASNYLSGNFFFDIHPPLIKLLFAGVGSVFHLSAAEVAVGDFGGTVLRVIPALAGAALVPLIYIILRQLRFNRWIASLGGILILLDNALLVESRFVLMDSLLLLAGFGAMSAYLALRKSHGARRWMWVVVMAALLGALVSTKWTGFAIFGLLGITWLIEGIRHRTKWTQMVGEGLAVLGIVACVYLGSFMANFALLTQSGEGDAFMSDRFQSTLIGNPQYDPSAKMSMWDKIVELNTEMLRSQSSLNDTTHPYASRWYAWPVQLRPVYFWQSDPLPSGSQGHIYLLGNPVVWILGAISVITALVLWLCRPKLLGSRRNLVAFLLTGYAFNIVPFAFIDRPMFLYHYLFALIISILIACVLAERLFDWQTKKYSQHAARQTYWVVILILILGFMYFLPISYGWSLGVDDLQQRMWLPTWR